MLTDLRQFGQNFVQQSGVGIMNFFDPETGTIRTNAMRQNSTLRKDQWKQIDDRVLQIARQRLNVVADLQAAGLIQPLGGIGVSVTEFEKQTGMNEAQLSMDLEAQLDEDTIEYQMTSILVPVLQKDFRIGFRKLAASRMAPSTPLDTTMVSEATRVVVERGEGLVLNGGSGLGKINNASVPGLRTVDNRNMGASGSVWSLASPGAISTDILAMVEGCEEDHYYGDYNLYLAQAQFGILRAYASNDNNRTVMERVLAQIPTLRNIKPSGQLTSGDGVLLQMTQDVIDLAVAADLQTTEWNPHPFLTKIKVWNSFAPRPKSDADDGSGIYHRTGL